MDPSLFAGTAGYYRQFRPGVPPNVAAILDDATLRDDAGHLRGHRRLLDLGTGTGQVVEALLGRFAEVIAVDPDASMLATAERALRPRVPEHVSLSFLQAGAEAVVVPDGWQADLVTICRAFHWMDQPAVLARLDPIVALGGAVALLGDGSFWEGTAEWMSAVRGVIKTFLGPQRRAGQGTFTPPARRFTDLLAESAFARVETVIVPLQRTWTTDRILGYLASTSFAAPRLFGDRLPEFEQALRAELAARSDCDTFVEDGEFEILIARRPSARQLGDESAGR
jgi:SAM-dependent methyltransferase